jgi:hypothetical protein
MKWALVMAPKLQEELREREAINLLRLIMDKRVAGCYVTSDLLKAVTGVTYTLSCLKNGRGLP